MKKGGYLDLFLTFARIGGLTFGGGYAIDVYKIQV